ncbi:major facilitator superfamily domain-containing protein [Thamnidium elegans]|nr:major facilitator superfamily domain-containing protein [Thamnidium elegans]
MSSDIKDDKSFEYNNEKLAEYDSETNSSVEFVKSAEEKAFLKKLNWRVLPVVFLIIFIQFCDKSALSVAAVLGIREDAGMTDDQFAWLGSIFYLGFLFCQVPNNYLIQKFPVGRYLGVMLVIWGIIMGATAACNTYPQLMALRFLLGLFEGVTYPCVYIVMNTLYRRSEQSACWGFLGVGTGMGTVFGVVIAYGLSHMDGVGGFRAWRWGYIVFGILTVLIGFITFFCLIDDPHHKLLRLTEKEKEIVEERSRDNCVVKVLEIKRDQIWEAVKEPRLWLLITANMLNCLQNGGLITFSTLLVEGLGFSSFVAILLQIPNGVAAAAFAMGFVWLATRTKKITFSAIAASLVSLLGCVLMATVPGTPKLAGFYLTWAMTGVGALIQTLVSNNVSGYTKRVFYNSMGMVAMTVGNFIGPLMMTGDQAPTYSGAMIGYSISNVGIITCLFSVYFILKKGNKSRLEHATTTETDIYLDLTDKADKNFVYKL